MRIVIDMQGAQTESRFRGIGRYTLSFTQAVVRNCGEHEVILALSSMFPETIEPIRASFSGLLPQANIRVWGSPGPVSFDDPANDSRRIVAELMRESFLASLLPDVVHINSLFEGYGDNAVTSIGRYDCQCPVSLTLHDLIPLLYPDQYLKSNPRFAAQYAQKIEHFKRASLYLAVSESSREEGLANFNFPLHRCVNTSEAIEARFGPVEILDEAAYSIRQKFCLKRPFVLYTGGADIRKNLPRLIQAFAVLPASLRASHQLVFAGKMPDGNLHELHNLAKIAGLSEDELCCIGYVTDEELIQLYNMCRLFVFPSWHEGFGLPVLEAMACGAPVIGSNTASLPEVIGHDCAMFDPFDVNSIAAKITEALEDDNFRSYLREYGLRRAQIFSWDTSAKRAVAAWESLHADHVIDRKYIDRSIASKRLFQALAPHVPAQGTDSLIAVASMLAQNMSVGIERQLMLDVSEISQRDASTGVQRVVRSYLQALLKSPPAGFRVEPVYALDKQGYRYARRYMRELLELKSQSLEDDEIQWQRGDIFFGLDMQHHVQLDHDSFYRQLRTDGVIVKFLVHDLLPIQYPNLFKDAQIEQMHERWLSMIASTDGAICVSMATLTTFDNWLINNNVFRSPNFKLAWVHNGADFKSFKSSCALPQDSQTVIAAMRSRPSFLCVSTIEPRKKQEQILGAIELLWADGLDVNIIFVGKQGWHVEDFVNTLSSHSENDQRLFWLNDANDEYLEQVYMSSTCLIAASVNEGFGLGLVEAAHHGVPIVARDIPIFREVANGSAYYFSGETPQELASALVSWIDLYSRGVHPRSEQMKYATWQESSEKLKSLLVGEHYARRQLFVDISELIQRDAKSGIQRVVRSILTEWLKAPPTGYSVQPVYATLEHGYRYANCFTANFIGASNVMLVDGLIDYSPGDVFFGLDMQPQVVSHHQQFYQTLRMHGVSVEFLVHDLLCIQMPQYFPPGSSEGFFRWLDIVTDADGVVCVSKTVAGELDEWVGVNKPVRQKPLRIQWSHNGADIESSVPSTGMPDDAYNVLTQLRKRKSFLMVGTIEPRKGHQEVLAAFEQLWQTEAEVNLVIVGKQGWMVGDLVDNLRIHPQLNLRLFWLEGISDEYLKDVYAVSTCLVAASYGEGFGLPLIEAAQHSKPIIARDIPVFREVAGEHAFYFKSDTNSSIADAIKCWLELFERDRHPKSEELPWLTWQASAGRLSESILSVH